jgi:hypothetical protein
LKGDDMPVIMPTVNELKHLSHHQRERIRRAIWRIIVETDNVAANVAANIDAHTEYGERIRQHARMLEATTPRDDLDTVLARRQALIEAIK